MRIGIAPSRRLALQSQGIAVIDAWTTAQQLALQQVVTGSFVEVPTRPVGEERVVYFKVDFCYDDLGLPRKEWSVRSSSMAPWSSLICSWG